MKKTNKPNPLKFFNDNKAMAYKKAGGEMKAYNKNLKKLKEGGPGSGMGSMYAADQAFEAMMSEPTQTTSSEKARALAALAAQTQAANMQAEGSSNVNNANSMRAIQARSSSIPRPTVTRSSVYNEMKKRNPGLTNEQMEDYLSSPYRNKKGGSVRRKK